VRRKTGILILALALFTGFTTATITSVDSITYNSNNDFFNGEVFAISVSSDQATDKIDIHLDESELDQVTDGDVNQYLTIDFTHQNTELRYSTTPSSNLRRVETFVPYHEQGFESKDAAITGIKASCYDLNLNGEGSGVYNQYYDAGSFSYKWEIYCFQNDRNLGIPAYVDNPDEIFTTNVELQASGKTVQTATLSNGDAGSGRTTDLGQHAKIMWNGNLATGASKPDNSRILALHGNRYSGSWRIINEDAYEDYKTYIQGGSAFDTLQDWAAGMHSGWKAAEWINDKAWTAAEVDTSSDLAYSTVEDSGFTSGAFTYDTEDLLVYPTFTVYVDAGEDGYIEVSKPTGEPTIVSSSGSEIEELGTGEVSATVRNVGDGQGSFSARLTSCSDGFTFSDDQRTKTVFPGNSVSYSFDVSFQSTSSDRQEISGSCTVQVKGVEESDSTSVSITGIQASECTAGEQSISVNENGLYEIYECKQNEQGKFLVKTCNEGEKAVAQGDNTFACEEDTGGGSGGGGDGGDGFSFPWPFDGSDGSGPGLLGQLHLGLSMIAGILVSVAGYRSGRYVDGERDIKGSFQPFKRRSVDRVKRGRFVAGAIGALVGFIVGTLVALAIPLFVQVIVIAGVGYLLYRFG